MSLSRCLNITDASVIVLAKKCLHLKSIRLESFKITDASLIAFATNSRKLQNVSLYYGYYITSTGLSILAVECAQMQSMTFQRTESRRRRDENLLSLRREYLRAKTSKHNRPTSVLSMLWHFISCK